MKKLMVAAVAVAMAVVANAASVKWSCPDGIGDGTDTGFTTATTVYLVNIATLTQAAIYDAVTAGATLDEAIGTSYMAKTALNEGGFDTVAITTAAALDGTKATAYMVLFDSNLNALYFSEELEKTLLGVGDTKFRYDAISSLDPVAADMSGFSTADGGWVSTAAVPEPTSGLLLLLGMAGLALKRKQA